MSDPNKDRSSSVRLYSYYRSSAAYRVRIGLALKGLDYDYVAVNLLKAQQKSSDYMAANPQGLVPALETDDGALIAQSLAILEWLEETAPGAALLPSDPLQRALVRSTVNSITCDIHPLNNLSVTNYLQNPLGVTPEQVQQWYAQWIYRGYDAIEKTLQRYAGSCCFGDQPTLADVCLIPQTYNAVRFKIDLDAYPNICRVWDYCNRLPAFIAAHPDQQPDAPPPG
jgi:maleylacetoacetate isomerase